MADRDDGPLLDLQVDHWTCTDPQNLALNTDGGMLPAPRRPLREWLRRHLGDPGVIWAQERGRGLKRCYNGLISVHRDRIQRWPAAFYRNLYEDLAAHHNPECNHYMERLWILLWGDPPMDTGFM
jgi:hypothetical protein